MAINHQQHHGTFFMRDYTETTLHPVVFALSLYIVVSRSNRVIFKRVLHFAKEFRRCCADTLEVFNQTDPVQAG